MLGVKLLYSNMGPAKSVGQINLLLQRIKHEPGFLPDFANTEGPKFNFIKINQSLFFGLFTFQVKTCNHDILGPLIYESNMAFMVQ